MIFKSGQYEGKTSEYVLLRHANHAHHIMRKYPESPTAQEFRQLENRFDEKPLTAPCRACGTQATVASAFQGNPNLMFWCSDCHPKNAANLMTITSFTDAMLHIDLTCNGVRSLKDAVIKVMAYAKGCPKRLTAAEAVAFLA